MASFLGLGLFDPDEADEPVGFSDNLDDYTFDSIEGATKSSKHASSRPKPVPEHTANVLDFEVPKVPSRSLTMSDLSKLVKSDPIGTVRVRTRVSSSHSEGDFTSLPPEPQQGNVEYKLKLVNPTNQRMEHLVTQMKWRLREGQGEAIYEIGVEDNGLMTGLCDEDMDSSLDTLREMARRLGATIEVLRDRAVVTENGPRLVAEILVRKVPDDQQCIELRVCVLGSADVGKSTLLGVLTQGQLDNGRGSARLNMFRHLHEVQTGRTSSISHEILGFDSQGKPVDFVSCGTADEIAENATKLITFIDLAGHQKYLRTTISGLTGYDPHYAMLVVSASGGVVPMTQEHLGIAVALGVPFYVVLTKVDVTPRDKLQATLDSLEKVLKSIGANKAPLVIRSNDDAITAANNTPMENVVPIFCISSVTGIGLDIVRRYLHLLPPGVSHKEQQKLEQNPPEFQIDEIFDVPGVGTVVGGLVTQGIITEGISLNLGPFDDGSFKVVAVTSIKRNRAACRLVRATQSAALAISATSVDKSESAHIFNQIRRGMVLLDTHLGTPKSCVRFQAQVNLLFHPTEIVRGFRTTVHVGNVRQTAVIEGIEPLGHLALSPKGNDAALVSFRFIKNPEYLREGSRLLFRDGRTKGIGTVTSVDGVAPCTIHMENAASAAPNRMSPSSPTVR